MILSLAKKHRKNLIAPAIAGGIIYMFGLFGFPHSASTFAPMVSEIVVILFFSWWGTRVLKAKGKEADEADKKVKENLECELDYFTRITNQIPETNTEAKNEADKHIIDLIKMRAVLSKQVHEKLDINRSDAIEAHKKSKNDLVDLENDMEEQIQKISSSTSNNE
ncbi:hypothetical protein I5481_19230 [Citrobacter freundii]|nr:hypothetical protein [Citrobacter freundii]